MLSSSRCPLHILFCMVYIARAACLALQAMHAIHDMRGCPKLQPGRASVGQNRRALQKYTSRCHVMDICRVLLASMHAPCPGAVIAPSVSACTARGVLMRIAQAVYNWGSYRSSYRSLLGHVQAQYTMSWMMTLPAEMRSWPLHASFWA